MAARQAAAAPASLPASNGLKAPINVGSPVNKWSEEFTPTATLDEHQAQFFSERDRSIDSQPLFWLGSQLNLRAIIVVPVRETFQE